MKKTTSIALGPHFTDFVGKQVETGRYGSVSEVVRAALRLLEEREARLAELQALIAEGEASGYVEFEPEKWMAEWKTEWLTREDTDQSRRAG